MSKKKPKEDLSNNPDKWRQLAEEASSETEENQPEEDTIFPTDNESNDQLMAMEKKLNEYKEQVMRSHAEMENLRRRAERDVANAHKYSTEKLIADLLPIADSMIRGLETPESKDPHVKGMREGIVLTIDLLNKTLSKHGVTVIDPKPGEPFNPDLHEAMSAIQDPAAKPNTIVKVMQQGYQLNGRVLRAAMVIVVKS